MSSYKGIGPLTLALSAHTLRVQLSVYSVSAGWRWELG